MMVHLSERVRSQFDRMNEAEMAGNIDEYDRLDGELTKILQEEHEKERQEYLDVFGIDIDRYGDMSYKFLNLEEGRKRKAMAEGSR